MTKSPERDPKAWMAFLKEAERERLDTIQGQHRELVSERRRIYFRCRKRMDKAERLAKAANA